MNRFFFFALLVLPFCWYVSAQVSTTPFNDTLCERNVLRKLSNNTGDFVCTVSNQTSVLPSEIMTIPLSLSSNTSQLNLTVPSDESLILVFENTNVTGIFNSTFNNGTTMFSLKVALPADITQSSEVIAEVSYDFDGNGTWDRVETYDFFKLSVNASSNSSLGSFMDYLGNQTNLINVVGQFTDLKNGSVRLRVWSPSGNSTVLLKVGASNSSLDETSTISFPFLFLSANQSLPGAAGGNTTGCCSAISDLNTSLTALQAKLDALSSRVLNVTRNCCTPPPTSTVTVSQTGTTVATATETASTTSTVAGTA